MVSLEAVTNTDDSSMSETNVQLLSCEMALECGHECKGVAGESSCLACLNSQCIANTPKHQAPLLASAAESELCGICYTCELGEEACVRLGCGHVFHANCVK